MQTADSWMETLRGSLSRSSVDLPAPRFSGPASMIAIGQAGALLRLQGFIPLRVVRAEWDEEVRRGQMRNMAR